MKFLCDNCKAKYQIADEKVAGKTVKMKCRKCGHLIEVKAAITETSVAKPAPTFDDKTSVDAPPEAPRPASKLARPITSAATKPSAVKESALAGAFQKTVQRDETSAQRSLRELASNDQWYVAINGVPVGPIRMSELRRKAASGAVTEDSLVWQEGLEEWRPLRTYPELAEAVREAIGRPSLLTPAPPEPAPLSPSPPLGSPVAPTRPSATRPATAPRSNVVPITSRVVGSAAEKLEEAPDPFAPDPFARKSEPHEKSEPLVAPLVAPPVEVASSNAIAPPTPIALEPRQRSVPWIPIAMIVLAACFGVTAAYAIFFRPLPVAPAPVVIVSAAPVTNTAPTVTTSAPTASQVADDTPPPSDSTPSSTHATGPKATTNATASAPRPVDPAIAALLNGSPGTGPQVNAGTSGGGGGSLTSDQIEAVVRNHQTGVKRTCWERANSQVSAVKITTHLTIGPSGNVTNAEAEGNDPIVAKCIENQVRNWQFPPTGSTSQVNIPFHFLRQ